jgi:hypothetical protein
MAMEAERLAKKTERFDQAISKLESTVAIVHQKFTPGDRIRAWRLDTMAKDEVLSVLDCKPMNEFGSGQGVKVRIRGRSIWLCSGLFYMVNVLTHPNDQTERP